MHAGGACFAGVAGADAQRRHNTQHTRHTGEGRTFRARGGDGVVIVRSGRTWCADSAGRADVAGVAGAGRGDRTLTRGERIGGARETDRLRRRGRGGGVRSRDTVCARG